LGLLNLPFLPSNIDDPKEGHSLHATAIDKGRYISPEDPEVQEVIDGGGMVLPVEYHAHGPQFSLSVWKTLHPDIHPAGMAGYIFVTGEILMEEDLFGSGNRDRVRTILMAEGEQYGHYLNGSIYTCRFYERDDDLDWQVRESFGLLYGHDGKDELIAEALDAFDVSDQELQRFQRKQAEKQRERAR
jgi:hypothetical protein